ncbi:probable transcription initiation factor IIA subunit 1 [Coccomyxa sp. Obi]|nr:probable transcription initiation factor IIA subunit 1 [Coccomyxa sp. Obi]
MQDSSVSTVYRNVIDDVIARVKLDFVQEGVDEAVLDELRVLWETKLQQSGVLESDISAPQPATGTYHASPVLPYPSFLSTIQGVQGQPQSSMPQQQLPAYSALSGLPPQHISQFQAPKQEQPSYHRQGFVSPSVQQHPVTGSYTLAAGDLVTTDRQIIIPAVPNTTSAAYGGSSLAPAETVGADSRKRKADDPLDAYGGHQRLLQPLPTYTAQPPQNGSIPQQDGSDDPADPKKSAEEETDNLSDVSSDKEEEEDCPNVVIAQFEKVSRTKSRWKCQLKDGIITINGHDYLFHRASGEMQF